MKDAVRRSASFDMYIVAEKPDGYMRKILPIHEKIVERRRTMPKKALPIEGAVSSAEALRFARVAREILCRPLPLAHARVSAAADADMPHIGVLREKRLHAAVKTYLCPDVSCHERPIGEDITGGRTPKRRMVADIRMGHEIIEVQTGGFFPLREKIAWYLENTDCSVTVVHPVAAVKYLSWIDPATGNILSRHRSPKRGRVKDIARELYWLSDFAGNERFRLRVLLLELEEYRMADGWSRDGKRGSNRYERFPTALLGDVTLSAPADYAAYFLPAALVAATAEAPAPVFTAADYAKLTGIRGRATYSMLRLLESLDLIRMTEEMRGRSRTYTARV